MKNEVYIAMNKREGKFWWFLGMQKIIVCLLEKYLPTKSNNKILDAGCGTGGWFSILSKYGQVRAVDKSEDAVIYARQKNIAQEVIQGDIEKLPYADNFFDIILCFGVLYHQWTRDDQAVLEELSRVLKQGGILIVFDPAYNWLRGHHDDFVYTKHRYNKTEMATKINKAGFIIKKITYVNFFLFPLALIKRIFEGKKVGKEDVDNLYLTNSLLNYILKKILFLEAFLINYINLPFGLSIVCVAGKK